MSAVLRFGYVDTAHGQMHYRAAGVGEPRTRNIMLLHWTPGSGAQYDAILHEFARRGFRAFAPDLAGYGASPGGAQNWLIPDFANNVLEIAQVLTPAPFALLGGHLAAEIAAQAARMAPERISHLLLDGSPTWDWDFRHKLLADIKPSAPVPTEDGSHLVKWWQHILWELKMWQPDFKLDENGSAQAMRVLMNDLQSRFDFSGLRALAEFEMAHCLPELKMPTLALSAATDPLRDQHEKVLALLPTARGHVFTGAHPIHNPRRAAEYADVVVDFIQNTTSPRLQ